MPTRTSISDPRRPRHSAAGNRAPQSAVPPAFSAPASTKPVTCRPSGIRDITIVSTYYGDPMPPAPKPPGRRPARSIPPRMPGVLPPPVFPTPPSGPSAVRFAAASSWSARARAPRSLRRCSSGAAPCARACSPRRRRRFATRPPLAVILDGITLYNLGHTLAEAAAKLKSRHGHAVAPSTLAGWIDDHRDLASYARLREAGRRLAPPAQTIRTVKLNHRPRFSI